MSSFNEIIITSDIWDLDQCLMERSRIEKEFYRTNPHDLLIQIMKNCGLKIDLYNPCDGEWEIVRK